MKLYRKVIRPYFKNYGKTHDSVRPEFMEAIKSKCFDESLEVELIKYIAKEMGLDDIPLSKAAKILCEKYHLIFEQHYIEYISVPKEKHILNIICDDLKSLGTEKVTVN